MRDKITIPVIILILGLILHPVIAKADNEVYLLLTKVPGSQWQIYPSQFEQNYEFYYYSECKKAAWTAQRSKEAKKFRLRFKCQQMTKKNPEVLI